MPQLIAPIVLFTYNRLDTLKETVTALKRNYYAAESELYIFSDAAKSSKDADAVKEVRSFLRTITGFKCIYIVEAEHNKGLANSIINGVTQIINSHNKVIVLEDDLITSENFLSFMNAALDKYEKDPKVFSVSGFMFDIHPQKEYAYDIFFTKRHCSWGWAIWKDRWNEIDWEINDFPQFIGSHKQKKAFDSIGSDLSSSLSRQMKGEINSWAIRCNYHQFKKQTYTVYPLKSKVVNMGFGEDATHTRQQFNKYKATLDAELNRVFRFPETAFEERKLLRRFTRKYSRITRIRYYILNKIYQII